MKRSLITAISLVVVLAAVLTGVAGITGGALRGTGAEALPRLQGGEASMEKLLDRFLMALRAKDRGALEAIRVTENEYRRVIVPGSVRKGEDPQRIGKEAFEYYWGLLNGKSIYHRENMVARFGGQAWAVKRARPQKGVTEYAGYTAHRRLVIEMINQETGAEAELETGSVAEVDGRFKFISFIRD